MHLNSIISQMHYDTKSVPTNKSSGQNFTIYQLVQHKILQLQQNNCLFSTAWKPRQFLAPIRNAAFRKNKQTNKHTCKVVISNRSIQRNNNRNRNNNTLRTTCD